MRHERVEKRLFGLVKKSTSQVRLVDSEGVIRLQKTNALVCEETVATWKKSLSWLLDELTIYNDGGTNLPNVYIVSEHALSIFPGCLHQSRLRAWAR